MTLPFKGRLGRFFSLDARRNAFQRVFRTPLGAAEVLPDLAEFCHAGEAMPRSNDLYTLGIAAGRLDVWLHIREYLELTEDELLDVYRGRSIFTAPQQG